MKQKLLILAVAFATLIIPQITHAAGISASGGATKTVGQQFTVTVTASGTTFDSLQGNINVSGPVSVVSFTPGSATWLPGKSPTNGGQFVGITSATSSITVAKITLKGTKEGSGSVSVSGVKLAKSGSLVGSDGGSTSFTITRALSPAGTVKVSSSSHPDTNSSYEATTIDLSWVKDKGVTGFSYLLDQSADTTPGTKVTSSDTSTKYENKSVGTYYFHIRAQNSDGWGSTTHFKVTIKEPDARLDDALAKTIITSVQKTSAFTTAIDTGTVSGILLKGTAQPGFTVTLTFTPAVSLPEGKSLSVQANEAGEWELTLDYAIPAGFYKVTAQAQKDKTLTPASDPVRVEVSLAKGGNVTFITEADAITPTPSSAPTTNPESKGGLNKTTAPKIVIGAGLVGALGIITHHTVRRRRR